MKCPECIKEGKKSIVTEGGTVYNAGPYYPTQYDEDGNRIPTPPIKGRTSYSCSNGHQWED